MFGNKKPSYEKLTTNLRISISRLKQLAKRKNEQSMKIRKEISECLRAEKFGRARLKTEQIIREDILIEALEMLELYCYHLLTKISVLSSPQPLESDTEQLVASILWASPRISEVKELKTVSNQLTYKFGKLFRSACLSNMFGNVNQKLIEKLEMRIPSDGLMDRYMEEIARTYKVPFKSLKPSTTSHKVSQNIKANHSSGTKRHSMPVENFSFVSSNPTSQLNKPKLECSKRHSEGQKLSNSLIDIVTSVKTSGHENLVGTSNGATYLERWLKNLKEV